MNNKIIKPTLLFPCNQSDVNMHNCYNDYISFLENSINKLFNIIEPSDDTDMNIEFTLDEKIWHLTEYLKDDNIKLK
jgi:hypothetical protein